MTLDKWFINTDKCLKCGRSGRWEHWYICAYFTPPGLYCEICIDNLKCRCDICN